MFDTTPAARRMIGGDALLGTARSRPDLLDALARDGSWRIGAVAIQRVATTPPNAAVHVAIIQGTDDMQFAVAVASRRELVRELADYVQRRSPLVLQPGDADHVSSLLARGELEAAVEVYFALVGRRRDEEWLLTAAVIRAEEEERTPLPMSA